MVYIFLAHNNSYNLSNIIRNHKRLLPVSFMAKAMSYFFEEDACRYLLGNILLLQGLHKLKYFDISLHDIRINKYDKPEFDNDISFNISHSGKYVICALSETCRVGVDVEEVRNVDVGSYSDCFSSSEWLHLQRANDPLFAFYHLWTRKEAVIKADGRGLQIPLSHFEAIDSCVSINSCNWFVRQLPVSEGYVAHLATDIVGDYNIVEFR